MKTKKRSSPKLEDFFSPNLSEDQKKRSSQKLEDFFSSNSSEDQRSDAGQSQIIEGDTVVDHTQIIEVDTVKLLGGISPRVSAPLFIASFKA